MILTVSSLTVARSVGWIVLDLSVILFIPFSVGCSCALVSCFLLSRPLSFAVDSWSMDDRVDSQIDVWCFCPHLKHSLDLQCFTRCPADAQLKHTPFFLRISRFEAMPNTRVHLLVEFTFTINASSSTVLHQQFYLSVILISLAVAFISIITIQFVLQRVSFYVSLHVFHQFFQIPVFPIVVLLRNDFSHWPQFLHQGVDKALRWIQLLHGRQSPHCSS